MRSYYIYLGIPRAQEDPWECTATSVGYERVRPGSPYPPRRHPVDHHFDWEHGRVLAAYQFVYVTDGQGTFESEVSPKRHRIEAGDVMSLLPGVWHRYAPDPRTGWVEQWIECCGPAFDRAKSAGLLRPERPVWRVGLPLELLQAFERWHALAQQRSPRVQSFRQAFKAQTGVSPKQYQLQIRLHKAQDFLANTPKSVGEIAEILGFDSAFHLSKQFKDSIGLAPQAWRNRLIELRGQKSK